MEVSIGGGGYRATINSYMYGDALAISKLAEMAGQTDLDDRFLAKAASLKEVVQEKLWDRQAQFFKVLSRSGDSKLADVRELHGFSRTSASLESPDRDSTLKNWACLSQSFSCTTSFNDAALARNLSSRSVCPAISASLLIARASPYM